jgi:hypothetical protein
LGCETRSGAIPSAVVGVRSAIDDCDGSQAFAAVARTAITISVGSVHGDKTATSELLDARLESMDSTTNMLLGVAD